MITNSSNTEIRSDGCYSSYKSLWVVSKRGQIAIVTEQMIGWIRLCQQTARNSPKTSLFYMSLQSKNNFKELGKLSWRYRQHFHAENAYWKVITLVAKIFFSVLCSFLSLLVPVWLVNLWRVTCSLFVESSVKISFFHFNYRNVLLDIFLKLLLSISSQVYGVNFLQAKLKNKYYHAKICFLIQGLFCRNVALHHILGKLRERIAKSFTTQKTNTIANLLCFTNE